MEIWPNIVNGEFWTVGNGNSVDVWHDKWEDRDLRLVEYLHRTPFNTNITVKDLVDAGGNWDLQFLQQLFPWTEFTKLQLFFLLGKMRERICVCGLVIG